MKNFVAVRTKYYKSSKGKSLEWHVRRDNKNKNTASVFDEHSKDNIHKEIRSRASCRAEYKQLNDRKIRSDFNEIFEHLLIFSRDKFEELEKKYKDRGPEFVKKQMCKLVEQYIEKIQKEYGFEPLRYDFHLDEGVFKDGKLQRNIHCHIMFYNYDFNARKGYLNDLKAFNDGETSLKPEKPEFVPLNPIKKKQKDENGNLKVNDAFSNFQDIAGNIFIKAGFTRGIKKSVSNADHLKRDDYIKRVQNIALDTLNAAANKLSKAKSDFTKWLYNISNEIDSIELPTEKIAENIAVDLDSITDDLPKETDKLDSVIEKTESKFKPPEKDKITPKRKRRRRKQP
tara:strand:- start:895 stop:1920 length:1026 start_codon:yes stop_codon:yes gene_type:complete